MPIDMESESFQITNARLQKRDVTRGNRTVLRLPALYRTHNRNAPPTGRIRRVQREQLPAGTHPTIFRTTVHSGVQPADRFWRLILGRQPDSFRPGMYGNNNTLQKSDRPTFFAAAAFAFSTEADELTFVCPCSRSALDVLRFVSGRDSS
ncbi:hypothetical protein B0T44_03260 [Nocardia donostiensis]|uniref:Uncharacterized protein n=1 Tax=Nocardia donostiensis TaxID=1538463 RepID=A0A1V2TGI5_9NOCA|nr:hypothetical protein B0T46_11260 [Nocardia donostiensis]OQS23274.1 hypothetical protein B0T44_03260 [Nocardia donostiensis]